MDLERQARKGVHTDYPPGDGLDGARGGAAPEHPGVDRQAARDVIGEIGLNMSRFGSDKRLCSWGKMSPGNNESAGKRHSGRPGRGNRYLRRVLVQCAWATGRTDTHLGRTLRRLEARIGGKKAAMAVGHRPSPWRCRRAS
jgi:transposase